MPSALLRPALTLLALLGWSSAAKAVTFATSVPANGYTMGNVFTASGAVYDDVSAAYNAPSPIVGAGSAYAGVLTPFNAHYQTTELVAIGRGGSITLQLASPVAVVGGPQIGVFTSAAFSDVNYPFGQVSDPAQTMVADEYGAERTAIVEVAEINGVFHSLGRVVFTSPTNYYANVIDPYQYPPPANPILADFGKPFAQPVSAFSGQNLAQVLATLDGSAGGTWIEVPSGLGLSEINFMRLSDPLWMLADGSLVETRTSSYVPSYVKPADLFIDAVAAIPEPGGVLLVGGVLIGWSLRRR